MPRKDISEKLEAGSDFDRLHNGKILYNNFLGKRKIFCFWHKK